MRPYAPSLIIIGLDGATWRVLDPLFKEGRLAHLGGLRRRGASGILRSEGPILNSPMLWTNIFTGKRPQKHGVHFFGATARSVRARRLWEIFDERGLGVGVCGTLVTWPPREVNGFIIPDLFALGPETYPPEFRPLQELALNEGRDRRRRGGWRPWPTVRLLNRWGVTPGTWTAIATFVGTSPLRRHPMDRYWRKAMLQPRIYGDVFVALCRRFRPDLACFHIHATDTISHRFWRYLDPESFPDTPVAETRRFGNVIPAAYEAADRIVGRIISLAGPETSIIVLSDHGFEARPMGRFKFNLRFDRLLDLMSLTGEALPARLGNTFMLRLRHAGGAPEVATRLEGFRVRETGENLFRIREATDDRVSFMLPDLTRQWTGTLLNIPDGREVRFEDLFEDRRFVDFGRHALEGVVFLSGPPFRQGATLEGGTIFDITPTALYLSGLPVADDMDGRVLTEAFTEEYLRSHSLARIPTYEVGNETRPRDASLTEEETLVMTERLKSLGYL